MPKACLAACLALILSLNPLILPGLASASEAGASQSFGLEPADRDAQLGARPAAPAMIRLGPPARIDPVELMFGLLLTGLMIEGGGWAGWEIGKNISNHDKPGETYAWPGAIIGGLLGGLLLWGAFEGIDGGDSGDDCNCEDG